MLESVGVKVEAVLYKGKTHTDLFVQVSKTSSDAPFGAGHLEGCNKSKLHYPSAFYIVNILSLWLGFAF